MYKVLIVDDEEIIKIGFRSIISWEDYGFSIIGTAENGVQALEMAKRLLPDVIITDLYMPIMDGFELIERVKEIKLDCEIVVLSNYGDIENVKKAMKMGAEDYILKVSYNQQDFIRLLEQLSEKIMRKRGSKQEIIAEKLDNSEELIRKYIFSSGKTPPDGQKDIYQFFLLVLPEHIQELEDSQYYGVIEKIETVLKEIFAAHEKKYFFRYHKSCLMIIINTLDHLVAQENTIYIKIQRTIALYLMVNCSILYENNIQGIYNLKCIVQEASNKLKILFWEKGCFEISEIKFNVIMNVVNVPQTINRYWGYIQEKNIERVRYELYGVLKTLHNHYIDPVEVKSFVSFLFTHIQVLIYQNCGQIALKDYNAQNANSAEELRQWIDEWIESLGTALNNDFLMQDDMDDIEKIKFYIEKHKAEKLRVSEIADKFKFHPKYLSTYFKEQTGNTLIGYINQVKMEYAKELISLKKYRIKEVALMVGIEDPFYFNKLFKSYYGCPPSKFAEDTSDCK